eukprot:TRINITY_DN12979_c0_g2_i1.p1 TRINITY_DN12979_c0_g2~~TRINITY_DN12979_c0_g2_i1.p1  ORF type:complete len:242 (-),score=32.12 TRINITY_DN12979_c0_g2_i1:113-838(-)
MQEAMLVIKGTFFDVIQPLPPLRRTKSDSALCLNHNLLSVWGQVDSASVIRDANACEGEQSTCCGASASDCELHTPVCSSACSEVGRDAVDLQTPVYSSPCSEIGCATKDLQTLVCSSPCSEISCGTVDQIKNDEPYSNNYVDPVLEAALLEVSGIVQGVSTAEAGRRRPSKHKRSYCKRAAEEFERLYNTNPGECLSFLRSMMHESGYMACILHGRIVAMMAAQRIGAQISNTALAEQRS